MIKRITTAAELRPVLDELAKMDRTEMVMKSCKHVAGDWDINHLKAELTQLLVSFRENAVVYVYFRDNKPNSIFAGIISSDWVCNKTGLNEIIWVSCGKSFLDGVLVLKEVEKLVAERGLDFLSCHWMCNGGDPRVQMFYINNGFRLDTLTFVKNYK
jgi:hypothetical protein